MTPTRRRWSPRSCASAFDRSPRRPMSITAPRSDATHEVVNQVPPLENRNLFLDNAPLVEALEREGGGWASDRAIEAGAFWGGEPQEWGRLANENPPVLRTHDRVGNRLDSVDSPPAGLGRLPSGVAPADGCRQALGHARAAVERAGRGRARGAGGDLHERDAGR